MHDQSVAQKTLHKILSSPARCDTVTLSSHLWTHNHRLECCGIFCPPSAQVVRFERYDRFHTSRTIRGSGKLCQSQADPPDPQLAPITRTITTATTTRPPNAETETEIDDRDRSAAPAKKTAPTEQTNAENFYYQKQMQTKTPMVVVLRDGEEVHGYIEWYDKHCIKLNRTGAANLMIYKPAIKYMFKEGENGRK